VEAALKNRSPSFVIDGEAVLLGVDGISDFNVLHSRQYDDEVRLYAFDLLALGGDDLRELPLHLRENNLARLPAGNAYRPRSTLTAGAVFRFNLLARHALRRRLHRP
jgi:ATP-dependent DNA ligase